MAEDRDERLVCRVLTDRRAAGELTESLSPQAIGAALAVAAATRAEAQPDYWDDEMDEEEEFWTAAEMNCHMHADGQCGAAGSEHCDFECPFRDGTN